MLIKPEPIEYVDAVAVIGEPKYSGRTHPLQMVCETNGSHEEYIVKLWANPEMHLGKHHLAREIYGSLLAQSFGIDTPDIAIVVIDADFYLSQPNSVSEILRLSHGLNFGSKFLTGAKIFNPPVPPSLMAEAAKIFCFDMLIGNMDRRVEKPNIFHEANGFVIFDHEQAFPYSKPQMLAGGYPKGWDFIKESWHKLHAFYPSLKKQDTESEIDEFVSLASFLTSDFLDIIEEQIPDEWITGSELDVIRDYLLTIRDNMDNFKRSLQEILNHEQ